MRMIIPALLLTLLAGCAAPGNTLILSPRYQGGQVAALNGAINLNVQDARAGDATLLVNKGGKQTTATSPELAAKLNAVIGQAFTSNGMEVSYKAARTLNVTLHHLQAIVSEQTFEHQSEAVIELGVEISDRGRSFNKLYNGKSQFSAPLGHDRAKVEAQLNKLIEQLATRIVSDPELTGFLQE